jgi:hypothetical protein
MQVFYPNQMMTGDSKKKKSDRRQIDIQNEWEISYWSQRLGCSPEQLVAVVNKVGKSPVKVARELEK